MARRSHRLNWRMALLILTLGIGVVAVVARLAQVQIVRHEYYAQRAEEEHLHQTVVREPRGSILDRNGYPLATTVTTFDVYVDPRSWREPATALRGAAALAPLLGRAPADLLSAVAAQAQGDYLAARGVDAQIGLDVLDAAPAGVTAVSASRRHYPEGDVASALLGFTGRDQVGLTGIEADFERELGGVPATVYFERDGLGNPIPFGRRLGDTPIAGGDVRLTIDRHLQRLADQALDRAVEAHKATGGTIIMMDPKTGEVLAMASRPSFRLSQLNLQDAAQGDFYRNRAVTDTYAPGSLIKTITMAAAIDSGLVTPDSTYYDVGVESVPGASIRNWDLSSHGTVTATEILQYSLNTGAVWLSSALGPDRFYDYLHRFGFAEETHAGLGGEAAGLLRTNQDEGWCECDLATNSFGQSIAATPLQVITAVAALVNGGELMRPYIVREVDGPDGRQVSEPVVVRRVVSEGTAQTLVEMMNAVVDGVPSHLAQVPGYRIGGKTGTSTFTDRSTTIASFIGFAPVEDPRFIMLVKIDESQDDRLGGLVAAPVFAELAPQILAYLGVYPNDAALVERDR